MDEVPYFAVTRSVRTFTKKSLDILKQTALSIGWDNEQVCPTFFIKNKLPGVSFALTKHI
jgi:hypothetical protein